MTEGFLNGDTLKVIELIKQEVQPVRDDVKDLSDDITENVIPMLEHHDIYIQSNRSDIETIREAPGKRFKYIFWALILIMNFCALFKPEIAKLVKMIIG